MKQFMHDVLKKHTNKIHVIRKTHERERMAMKGFNVFKVTQQPRLPPITTVKLPSGKCSSNALDIHSEFRRKWNPIHCTHQGTSQEQRQFEATASFKNLLEICQESFSPRPFK